MAARLRFPALFFCLIIVNASPASAFFGSECRKAKSSLEKLSNEYRSSQAEINRLNIKFAEADRIAKSQWGKVNCENKKQLAEANRKYATDYNTLTCVLYSQSGKRSGADVNRYENLVAKIAENSNIANQVIVSNAKCFDPIVVAKAQLALQKP